MTQEQTVPVITDSAQLAAFCDRLKAETYITVDTEFMRERTYYPQLSLIQIAGANEAAVVDGLGRDMDLGPFWDLMRNPSVLKVFHAPRQDIEIFVAMAGVLPQPLFDTQVGAMAMGFVDQVSYAKLAEALTGTTINKEEQFTDWTVRPLRPAQLSYALQDVTVLRGVYEKMVTKLKELGRLDWVAEEMARLNDINYYRVDPDATWERIKLRSNKPASWAALRALGAWREKEAMRVNRPRQMILKDEVLAQIAMTVPTTREQLSRTRGLPGNMNKDATVEAILALMQKAKQAGPDALPPRNDNQAMTPAQEDALDLLRLALKIVARQKQIAPRMLASNDDLSALVLGRDTPLTQGWRAELFGDQARALLDGTMAITTKGLVKAA
jgi:ribonuclease D